MSAFSRTRALVAGALAACAAGTLACSGGGAAATTPTVTPPISFEWTQVWSDEFDGPAGTPVDATKWGYDLGDGCSAGICGWGNKEKEVYTSAPENVSLNGQGQLAIVARRTEPGSPCAYASCRYTSAKITTRGKMAAAPGRVEARIKLPAGQGLWPAFWMLGNDFPGVAWPACGEFDIMENRGSLPSSTSSAVHGPGYSGDTPFINLTSLPSGTFGDDFHLFAVEWDAAKVQFSVDGTVRHTVSREMMSQYGNPVLDKSYFVILNLAVGGNFDGDPKSDTIFPATMLVDYVRVFGLKVK